MTCACERTGVSLVSYSPIPFPKKPTSFLARRLRTNKAAMRQAHLEATRSLCNVSRARGCPVRCPKVQRRPSCAAKNNKSLARRERRLASLYAEAFIAYLKISLQYHKDKFKALAAQYLDLVKRNKRLQRAHEQAKRDLSDARKFLREKRQQVKNLKPVLKQCQTEVQSKPPFIAQAKKEHDDVANQVKSTEAVRDQHRTRARAAAKQTEDANKEAEDAKSKLAAAQAKLKALCPYKDGCDVCKGDGSVCAKQRQPSQCHAVGDPHFRCVDVM